MRQYSIIIVSIVRLFHNLQLATSAFWGSKYKHHCESFKYLSKCFMRRSFHHDPVEISETSSDAMVSQTSIDSTLFYLFFTKITKTLTVIQLKHCYIPVAFSILISQPFHVYDIFSPFSFFVFLPFFCFHPVLIKLLIMTKIFRVVWRYVCNSPMSYIIYKHCRVANWGQI